MKQISRRTMLGTAAAMAATPAFAEGCQVGPPEHHKGPLVFKDYDQLELDASYDQVYYERLIAQVSQRLSSNSDATRNRIGAPQRAAYGPTEIEKLDIYRTNRPNAPVFVFIHGGNWRVGSAKQYGYAAEMFINAGAHYGRWITIAIKEAGGDLGTMAAQVRRGIAWVYKNAASFGGDPERIFIGGHSSGGHLCGVALVTDWQKDFETYPRKHSEGRTVYERHVRDGTGTALVASHLRKFYRRDGRRNECAAAHRQATRANHGHVWHLGNPRLSAPES